MAPVNDTLWKLEWKTLAKEASDEAGLDQHLVRPRTVEGIVLYFLSSRPRRPHLLIHLLDQAVVLVVANGKDVVDVVLPVHLVLQQCKLSAVGTLLSNVESHILHLLFGSDLCTPRHPVLLVDDLFKLLSHVLEYLLDALFRGLADVLADKHVIKCLRKEGINLTEAVLLPGAPGPKRTVFSKGVLLK